MWTKEDLQGKYIKITSQQDYETVVKVLEELGIQQDKEYLGEKYKNRFNAVFVATKFCYFLSESKYSDIPIQQFYDYLSSKTLKIEDLVESEIYKYFYDKCYLIAKCSESKTLRVSNYIQIHDDNENNNLSGSNNCVASKSVQLASTEEKKHFQVCIKQDKFIPKEDLDLYDDTTFESKSLETIPEYVECIKSLSNQKIGDIEKTSEVPKWTSGWSKESFWKQYYLSHYKPSTKEAFEAQNKPKYEVGKWYKINGYTATYRKCSNAQPQGSCMSYNESIEDGRFLAQNNGNCNNSNNRLQLLTDLSEIQQYLPDNHVDKIKPTEINEFKKGDYIVITTDVTCKGQFDINFIYKQRENYKWIRPEFDSRGSCTNGLDTVKPNSKNYRYATPEEIAEYDRIGKPYDVTTLNKSIEKSLVGRYVMAVHNIWNIQKGEYLKILEEHPNSFTYEKYGLASKPISSSFKLMPEGFTADNVSKEEWIPKEGDWVYILESANKSASASKNKGKVVKVIYAKHKNIIISNLKHCGGIYLHEIRKAEPHEIPKEESNTSTTQKVIKEMSKEELLEEAKRRYPIGTKFYTSKTGVLRTIKDEPFLFNSSPLIICCKTKENSFNAEIYTDGKWAEIVELPKSHKEDLIERYKSKTIDLTNTKIRVDTPELSKLVQEKAFELGWKWCSGGKTIQLTNSKFLFFSESFIRKSDEDEKYFIQHSSKEIFPSDLGIDYSKDKPGLAWTECVIGKDTSKEYPLTSNKAFKIDNNQVNLLVKQSESVTLKRTENEVNIKVNNLKTIKI